jgi:hypothetical protein
MSKLIGVCCLTGSLIAGCASAPTREQTKVPEGSKAAASSQPADCMAGRDSQTGIGCDATHPSSLGRGMMGGGKEHPAKAHDLPASSQRGSENCPMMAQRPSESTDSGPPANP